MRIIHNKVIESKKLFKENKYMEIILVIVFFCQFCITLYFNLFSLENHMGYDSSWTYLKTALVWNEKSFFSDIWLDQTNIFLDSSLVLAALIYGIIDNIFVSYGIANMVIVICVLACMNSIMKLLNIDAKARLFALNMVLCPYLTKGFIIYNEMGYFYNMLCGPAFYGLRVLIMLLLVREIFIIKKRGRIDILGYVALLLCVLSGISSGVFIIVMLLFPCLLFLIEEVLLKNDYKVLFRLEALYTYLGVLCVFSGKFIGQHFWGISAFDSTRTWTTLENFFANMAAPVLGFMKLLGVLPANNPNVVILSKEGISIVFPLVIFIIIIICIAYAIKKVKVNYDIENGNLLFLINIPAINILVLGLFNAQYGEAVFEERYLVSTFMVIILLVAYYLDRAYSNLIFSKMIPLVLLLCIIADNYISDRLYIGTTNDSWQMADIKAVVDSQDAELVYVWGDELQILERSMRAYDLNHVYKYIKSTGDYYHWGDYLYYEDNAAYSGSTILIIPANSDIVPSNIMSEYTMLENLNNVSIYKAESNEIDRVSGLTGDVSIDFPTSPNISTNNGQFDGNSFISDGTEGFVMWGPSCQTVDGTFDFTLEYEVIDGSEAVFDVALDQGESILGEAILKPSENEVTINNIPLESGHLLEYRVQVGEGDIIRINKVIIRKN